MSKLPMSDPRYKPLYLDKAYKEDDRQIEKYRARMEWFKKKKRSDDDSISEAYGSWRRKLKGVWKGSGDSQKPVLEKGYTSVISVPNTTDAMLTKKLIKCETKLAKLI